MNNVTPKDAFQKINNLIKFEEEIDRLSKELRKEKKQLGVRVDYTLNNPNQLSDALDTMFGKDYNLNKINVFEDFLKGNTELAIKCLTAYRFKLKNDVRSVAFNQILSDRDYIYNNFIKHLSYSYSNFSDNEIHLIYIKHGKYFFEKVKNSFKPFYNYCKLFNSYLSEQEIELFVKRIIGRKKYKVANEILMYKIVRVNNEMTEILNSLLLMEKMSWGIK